MKISKIIFAITIVSMVAVSSCKETKTETAVEKSNEQYIEDKIVDQEEFKVNESSANKTENIVANEENNNATIVVKANKAVEYKFKISQFEKLEYEWKSDAPLHYDFHGDPEVKEDFPSGYFESYAIGNSDSAKGKITIPYQGSHGWYWKNESGNDITITLTTKGKYDIIGLIQ